jgi:16S rRNA (guanine966-N2)-methyltransferase
MVAPGVRVIAGTARGRRLTVPKGELVRPTKDRVKAAVFSALESRGLLVDAVVIDLYAGSGALAIEALSRGAARATLVERHGVALEAIAANVSMLNLAHQCDVRAGDVATFVRSATTSADLVFCDPPYGVTNRELSTLLADVVRLVPGGTLVVERPTRPSAGDQPEMSVPSDWRESWKRVFGDTLVTFWTPS